MCGGFTITADKKKIIKRFNGAEFSEGFVPRYNARPFQKLPILTQGDQGKSIRMAMWEYALPWEEKKKIINIRAESLHKSFYKHDLAEHRCLIPVDGFYEWEKAGKMKIPHKYSLFDGDIFSLAGLYQVKDDEILFAIITVPANEIVGKIHDRMPAIIEENQEKRWLMNGDVALRSFQSALKDEIVTVKVNRSGFDEPY